MEEKKLLKITNMDGTQDSVEVIIAFQFNDNQKEYIVYTKNELDAAGNVTIYVSELLKSENSEVKLGGIESDEEWARIKDVLRKLSKSEA